MYCSKKNLIQISAFIWFCVGLMLLSISIRLMLQTYSDLQNLNYSKISFFPLIHSFLGTLPSMILTSLFALFLGFAKGRFILSKSVKRQVLRIKGLTQPVRLNQIYTPAYYALLLGMMSLGFVMRALEIPIDIRALIDIAVGSALLQGSVAYIRASIHLNLNKPDSYC